MNFNNISANKKTDYRDLLQLNKSHKMRFHLMKTESDIEILKI